MTKEEMTICKIYLEDIDKTHDCNEYKLLMALLEQQPSDDCVSRQAIADAVESTIAKYIPIFLGRYEKIPLEVAMAIKNVPPVTPTHKVGKWIKTGGSFRCSECMNMPEFKDIRTLKYCPNCSAEMRGNENE